ncbi:hypothetical protein [Altererythrobacter sp. Root672]|uniref:hypothetical protein n=1 Tax=Altererythrobacter sp. Root672 TaxID=1736584 RepID=UPI0006F8B603|nr:hypothetical protein [Altererythrobacter sp. Root672]KRA80304.1 hypothetical protein ASD76_14065 [Altererythrobacter sp. Root672]
MVRHRLDSLSAFARKGYHLRVECQACKHVVIADPAVLSTVIRGKKDINAIERRMRCGECGERRAHITAEPLEKPQKPKWIVAWGKPEQSG